MSATNFLAFVTCRAFRSLRLICLIGVLSLAVFSASAKTSAEVIPLSVQDIVHLNKFFESPSLSPDGRWLAYSSQDSARLLGDTTFGASAREVLLTIVNLETGSRIQLGSKHTRNGFPLWSPDSRWLAYISDRDGEMRLWGWNSATQEDKRLSASILMPFNSDNGRNLVWTPDSKHVVTRLARPGTSARIDVSPAKKLAKPIEVFVSHASRNDTAVNASSKRRKLDLGVIEVNAGTTRVLVEEVNASGNMSVSPDGRYLAYDAVNVDASGVDLKVIALDGGESWVIAPSTKNDNTQVPRWSPNSMQIVYSTTARGPIVKGEGAYIASIEKDSTPSLLSSGLFSDVQWTPSGDGILLVGDPHPRGATSGLQRESSRDTPGLWRVTLKTGELKELTPHGWDRRIQHLLLSSDGNTYWSPDEGRTAIIATHNLKTMHSGFWKVAINSGEVHLLKEEAKHYETDLGSNSFAISKDGSALLYMAQDIQRPSDIWMTSSSFRKAARQVTRLNPHLEKYAFGEGRLVSYRQSNTGEQLSGALILPAAYRPGQRYPLISLIYPGNRSLISAPARRFYFQPGVVSAEPSAQLFATRGYAVLYPAIPQRPGTPMRDIPEGLLPAVDQTIDIGVVDGDRLGLRGHSYGGYSTIATIAQTTRFKAAVVSAPFGSVVSAWLSLSLDSDYSFGQTWSTGQGLMTNSFWKRRDQYFENSPSHFLDRVQTPILILHGKDDHTVPFSQSNEIFAGLKSLGMEVEYRRYADEDHSLFKEENVVDALSSTLRWFDTYVKNPASSVANDTDR